MKKEVLQEGGFSSSQKILKSVVPFLECCDIWTYVVPWCKSTFMEENVTTYHVFGIVYL